MLALPFTITFGRPSRGELLSLGGVALLVGSALGWATTTAHPVRSEPTADPRVAVPRQRHQLAGRRAVVGRRAAARTTPATVDVTPGHHDVEVATQDALEQTRGVDVDATGASLQLRLWRAHPSVTYLKPPLPGAALVDASFLADGCLALQVAAPDGERQAWPSTPTPNFATQR
jgi:hypothetical protein